MNAASDMFGYADINGVHPIARKDCERLVLDVHYAHRWPSVSYAFGLFDAGCMRGVVTFGTPSSAPLRAGICGAGYAGLVIELNRLVLWQNLRNDASRLVGGALRQLGNHVVVSFADTAQQHIGYVYQATNFIYTGLSAKRTDWVIEGAEGIHGQTIADEFRGVENRAAKMREKYGDAFSLADRPRKHRYITFTGDKRFRKRARSALLYPVEPYPKAT